MRLHHQPKRTAPFLTVAAAILGLLAAHFPTTPVQARPDNEGFTALRQQYLTAKRDSAIDEMGRLAGRIGAVNNQQAARFLISELEGRHRDGVLALPEAARPKIAAALGGITDERAVAMISRAAMGLREPRRDGEPFLMFDQFEIFKGFAEAGDAAAPTQALRDAISQRRNPYVKIAAIEAVRQTGAHRFLADVANVLREDNRELAEQWPVVAMNVFDCLRTLVAKDDVESAIKAVQAAIDWRERGWCRDARARFHCERMLREITGETVSITSLHYWRWWVGQMKARGVAEGGEKPKLETGPETTGPVFDTKLVGTRHVFAIDVSSSMRLPLAIDLEEIQRRRGPTTAEGRTPSDENEAGDKDDPLRQLPWETIKTRLDLAREELSRAIRALPEGLKFAIVVYSTTVRVITDGFVDSTPENVALWSRDVRNLQLEAMTNIHGALMQSLRISDAGIEAEYPAVDRSCLLTGADTIVFMTDGWGTWDDRSKERVIDPRNPEARIGDGPFVLGEAILPDILRHNMFRKVVINTVGIGNHDRTLMLELAKATGGNYVDWSFPSNE